MYNEELKKRFIVECVSPAAVNAYVHLFNFFEKYEEEWGADLCTRSSEELQPAVDNAVGLRSKSKNGRIVALKRYIRWCIKNEVSGAQDGMKDITVIGLEKVRSQTVANPKHLQACLDSVYLPESKHTIDNILRGYYWFAYSGLYEEDIFELTGSDIDLDGMRIYYRRMNRYVPIYVEGLEAIRNCKEMDRVVIINPRYTKEKVKPRMSGDLVMRGTRGDWTPRSVRTMITGRAKEMQENTGVRLSHSRAWLSGIFYRAQELEKFQFEPDLSEFVEDEMAIREYESISETEKRNRLLKEITEDYNRWKLAWNV